MKYFDLIAPIMEWKWSRVVERKVTHFFSCNLADLSAAQIRPVYYTFILNYKKPNYSYMLDASYAKHV